MPPWVERPTLHFDLSRPLDQWFRHVPATAIADGVALLKQILEQIPRSALMLADLARVRTFNRFQREVVAVAQAVGLSWREVMLGNLSYDLVMSQTQACSTVAAATRSGPVLARNMDWSPARILAQTSYLIQVSRHEKLCFVHAGWPGAVAVVSGQSARGFAVVVNAVPAPFDSLGYPVLLHLRSVVERAQNFQEAVEQLSYQRLTCGAIFTVVGSENRERVVIERTSRRYAYRTPEQDGLLVATNHYLTKDFAGFRNDTVLGATACQRFDALLHNLRQHTAAADLTDAQLLYALTDPQVQQSITAQHVLFRPRTQTARLWVPRALVEDPLACADESLR